MLELLYRWLWLGPSSGRDAEARVESDQAAPRYVFHVYGGGLARFCAGLCIALSILCYIWTEMHWIDATANAASIGMGESAYTTVGFTRAIVFAVLAIAFGVFGIANRRHTMS